MPPVYVAGFSLSNYISAEEACDWTGKREVQFRGAETESISGEEGQKQNGGRCEAVGLLAAIGSYDIIRLE